MNKIIKQKKERNLKEIDNEMIIVIHFPLTLLTRRVRMKD